MKSVIVEKCKISGPRNDVPEVECAKIMFSGARAA